MRLNRNGKIAAGILAVAVCIGIITVVISHKENEPVTDNVTENTDTPETTPDEAEVTPVPEDEQTEVIDETVNPDDSIINNEDTSGESSSGQSASVTPAPAEPEPVKVPVTLPYRVPNSDLIIEQIVAYNGQYLEDGSDEDVSNIVTLLIYNSGSRPIEFADIKLYSGSQQLAFTASDIPANARLFAQEKSRAQFTGDEYYNCTASVATMSTFEMDEKVQLIENESSLTLINQTWEDIPCVRVYYKLYMEEENAYVGGITYVSKVVDLKAGSSVTISPSHYYQGYSQVMMIRTYDTAD